MWLVMNCWNGLRMGVMRDFPLTADYLQGVGACPLQLVEQLKRYSLHG